MNYRLLFILIEGDDDERFFERIIKGKLEQGYGSVKLWKYAKQKKNKIDNFLRSIKAIGADYFYVVDLNRAPCITRKKEIIQEDIKNIDKDRIIVVIKEIESWYLAGLDIECCKKVGITHEGTTDNVTKEQFNYLIPKKFNYRIDFMHAVLNYFCLETAKQKNTSFSYFIGKHGS